MFSTTPPVAAAAAGQQPQVPAAALVDVERAERKVWIVRVPPHVAKQWHAAIAAAGAGDEQDGHDVLGTVTVEQGQATTLLVPGEGEGNGQDGAPQLLHMNASRDSVDTAILSYEAARGGGIAAPCIDGVAFKRFDAGPVKIAAPPAAGVVQAAQDPEQVRRDAEARQRQAAAAQAQVDSSYLQSSRRRLQATKASGGGGAHKIELLSDLREIKALAGGVKAMPLWSHKRAKRGEGADAGGPKPKRERMSRDAVEEALFELFGQQQHWAFPQIQRSLDQPGAFLKEVLIEVADQVKRGPLKDMWVVKKQFADSVRLAAAKAEQRRRSEVEAAKAAAAADAAEMEASGAPGDDEGGS